MVADEKIAVAESGVHDPDSSTDTLARGFRAFGIALGSTVRLAEKRLDLGQPNRDPLVDERTLEASLRWEQSRFRMCLGDVEQSAIVSKRVPPSVSSAGTRPSG